MSSSGQASTPLPDGPAGGFVNEEEEPEGSADTPLARRTEQVAKRARGDEWNSIVWWSGSILVWYCLVQLWLLPSAVRSDPRARELMLSQVSLGSYRYSEAAFFTASVLNTISFVFEETQEKRQLALLSALIKALSWHCDYLITTGQAIITFDGYGALLLPSRYVQWSCTTPTMLLSLSKISDFTATQTAFVMAADWVMVLTGYLSAVYPPGFASYFYCLVSFATFYYVLWGMHLMIQSAVSETSSPHAKTSLRFTLWSSVFIWHLFPVAWLVARLGPRVAFLAEPMLMFSNFAAKVVFSSCILYNNYVTLQQRRMAAQLEQEQRDRIKLVGELKASLVHKDQFISVIGHELRAPLNAIIQLSAAVAQNMGRPGTLHNHRVWMQTVHRSSEHLLGIINDIITIRAVHTGMRMKQELVHMKGVVDHVIRTLSPMAKRGVTMERFIADKLPPIVADERRVIQLLSNLLGNALKFTDKGKVSVSVRTDKGARNVVIKIQDTGCGIPRSELKQLLVPFKQANMGPNRKYGGTGLGLSISDQLVQAHCGTMELYSQEGQGTTVVVKLPVLQPETHCSLERQFREAYTSAGHDFEDLVNAQVAKAEGRRSAVFRTTTDAKTGFVRKAQSDERTSNPGDLARYQWDSPREDEEGSDLSAAGSCEAGPPPVALALFSSLYSSTPAPRAGPGPSGATVKVGATAEVTGAPQQQQGAAPTPERWPEERAVSAAYPEGQQPQTPPPATPSTAGSLSEQLQGLGGGGTEEGGGGGSAVAAREAAEGEEGGEQEEEEDEFDDYAGSLHRTPQFGDEHDGNKEYYKYDNRLSFDYRPSLDFDSGSAAALRPAGGGGTAGGTAGGKTSQGAVCSSAGAMDGTAGVVPRGTKGSSIKSAMKSALRRSIDAVRLKALSAKTGAGGAGSSGGGAAAGAHQQRRLPSAVSIAAASASVTDEEGSYKVWGHDAASLHHAASAGDVAPKRPSGEEQERLPPGGAQGQGEGWQAVKKQV